MNYQQQNAARLRAERIRDILEFLYIAAFALVVSVGLPLAVAHAVLS